MDVSWSELPHENLEDAYRRASANMDPQEASNSIYGLSMMDTTWNELASETKRAIYDSIRRTSDAFTIQEIANIMYSFAIMTFDAVEYSRAVSPPSLPPKRGRKKKVTVDAEGMDDVNSSSSSSSSGGGLVETDAEILTEIHKILLRIFKKFDFSGE
jgi:hypothetical protein